MNIWKKFSSATVVAATFGAGMILIAATDRGLAASNNAVLNPYTMPGATTTSPHASAKPAAAAKSKSNTTALPAAKPVTVVAPPPKATTRDHRPGGNASDAPPVDYARKRIEELNNPKTQPKGYCDPKYSDCQQAWNIPGSGLVVVKYEKAGGPLLPGEKEKLLAALQKWEDSIVAKNKEAAEERYRAAQDASRRVRPTSGGIVRDHRAQKN